jgi:hypothetical protein
MNKVFDSFPKAGKAKYDFVAAISYESIHQTPVIMLLKDKKDAFAEIKRKEKDEKEKSEIAKKWEKADLEIRKPAQKKKVIKKPAVK